MPIIIQPKRREVSLKPSMGCCWGLYFFHFIFLCDWIHCPTPPKKIAAFELVQRQQQQQQQEVYIHVLQQKAPGDGGPLLPVCAQLLFLPS